MSRHTPTLGEHLRSLRAVCKNLRKRAVAGPEQSFLARLMVDVEALCDIAEAAQFEHNQTGEAARFHAGCAVCAGLAALVEGKE